MQYALAINYISIRVTYATRKYGKHFRASITIHFLFFFLSFYRYVHRYTVAVCIFYVMRTKLYFQRVILRCDYYITVGSKCLNLLYYPILSYNTSV